MNEMIVESSGNVFTDLGFEPGEAAILQMRAKLMNKAMPRGVKFPSIYTVGHNARQIAYLLSGISALARLAGYSGLCVLMNCAMDAASRSTMVTG